MRPTLTVLMLGSIAMSLAGAASAQQIGIGENGTAPQPSINGGRFTTVKTGQQVKDPGEFYLNAYNLCSESESLAQQKLYTQAIKKGTQAERVLAGIVRDFPEWRPNMVAARRKILAENLKRYREEAKSAPIPSGRQPGRAVPMEVNIPLPGLANADKSPPKTPDYTRVEMPDYESSNKDLYNALARAQEECRKMAEAYKELNTRFTDVQKQLNAAKIEQSMYKERYEDLQKQVRTEREAGNKVVESLSRQLAEMEEKYRNSEKARREAETRVSELEATLAATQEELERVTRERDALRSENEQLRAIVELNSPEKTKALLDQNLTLADQLKAAQERIAMLEGMMAGTDDQNTVLTQQLAEARDQANSLREEMSGIYDENRGYRRRISELTERLNNLEAELEASASRPVLDPALAEENKLLRDVIAKQRRTLDMQEEGRRLLVETYKQIKNQDPAMLSALKKLDDESSLDLTDAERRLIETIRKMPADQQSGSEGTAAVRRSLEVETLANLAAKAFSKGRYTSAEQLYRTLYDVQPDHVAGLVNLGTILLYRNKCEEAVDFFARAERLAPDLAISYYLAGTSYYRLDRMEEAERMFRRTVELDPANAEAFFYLANIEGISDRPDLALKHFAAAVKLKPGLGDAHYNMSRLYAEKGQIPDAARAYDRAIHAGSEPDPEFENYLRTHPDNAKAPGVDLVEEAKPEEEAAKLRAEDPEITEILENATHDTPEQTENEASPDDSAAPAPADEASPATEETEARARYEALQQHIAGMTEGAKAAPTPSPAGTAHVTDKKRFDDVRVRQGRRRVWLRLKRPEPQRIRPRGGDIRHLKKK